MNPPTVQRPLRDVNIRVPNMDHVFKVLQCLKSVCKIFFLKRFVQTYKISHMETSSLVGLCALIHELDFTHENRLL